MANIRLPVISDAENAHFERLRKADWRKQFRHSQAVLAKVPKDGQQRYCTYPFRLIGVASDYVKPCTWLKQTPGKNVISVSDLVTKYDGNLSIAIKEAWNSFEFNDVRKAIRDGSYVYCDMENCPEYHGDQKYFLTIQELEEQFPKIASFIKDDLDVYDGGPELINMAYDPRCNLSCPSCNRHNLPKYSEEIEQELGAGISLIGKDIQRFYIAGMGDPFGTSHYLKFLQNMKAEDYPNLKNVSYNTNAMKLTKDIWESIQEIRSIDQTMIVSMDGASAQSFEANRYPAKWSEFQERMKFVSELRSSGQIKWLQLYFVYQINNYTEMPIAVEFAKNHNADSIFFARIRDWNDWGNQKMDSLDVNRPSHPHHQSFKQIAESVKKMETDKLTIVVMD